MPRVNPIELPLVYHVSDYRPPPTTVSFNDHYIRFDPIPESQRQHEVEFEAMEEDLSWLHEICRDYPGLDKRLLTVEVLEKFLDAWEQDTQKGEIIPLERAKFLVVEELNSGGFWKETQGSDIITKLYHYWSDRRKELKHPLVRKFWKSEGASDHMLREVFQPRNHERMKLRGSRKNDRETFHKVPVTQMMKLKQNLEQVAELLQCVCKREQLKELQCTLRLKVFEVEKADNAMDVDSVKGLLSSRLVEESVRLRESSGRAEPPRPPPYPPQVFPSTAGNGMKENRKRQINQSSSFEPEDIQPTPLPPTDKNVCVELAMIACALIPMAERIGPWPILGPEVNQPPNSDWQTAQPMAPAVTEEQPMCRGRVMRGYGRRIALDRLFKDLATLQWGSYRGESGKYHEFDDDNKATCSTEEEENDGFRELHKYIQNQFKIFSKQRRGLAH